MPMHPLAFHYSNGWAMGTSNEILMLPWTDIKYWQHWLQSFAQIDRNLRTLVVTVFRVFPEGLSIRGSNPPLLLTTATLWWLCQHIPALMDNPMFTVTCHQYLTRVLIQLAVPFPIPFPVPLLGIKGLPMISTSWTISHRILGYADPAPPLPSPPFATAPAPLPPAQYHNDQWLVEGTTSRPIAVPTNRHKLPKWNAQIVNSDHWNALDAGISTKAIQHCNNINAQWLLNDCLMIA